MVIGNEPSGRGFPLLRGKNISHPSVWPTHCVAGSSAGGSKHKQVEARTSLSAALTTSLAQTEANSRTNQWDQSVLN